MQDKQKSTLYLPPELHQKLKIRAAVETQPMSAIAERAIDFYLSHPEVVDGVHSEQGHIHQVYTCPGCSASVVLRDGVLVSLRSHPGAVLDTVHTVPLDESPQPEPLPERLELGETDEQLLVSC
ncbi:MAG: hypothetical protein HC857_07585 [Synechococcales cyanobacterium RU_4_20]|nr:hypothetical protein [Synechococcales cyanobacterium RU_4_20]NJR67520.1 hypothetical protein [Synechococcales cyanobacterium CRU_2_2]